MNKQYMKRSIIITFNNDISTVGYKFALHLLQKKERELLMSGQDELQAIYCEVLWDLYTAKG